MGFFTKPLTVKETRAYELEKAKAAKTYELEKSKARLKDVKERARFDALPRVERAKIRFSKGLAVVRTGLSKGQTAFKRFEAFEKKAEAQQGGGLIAQSMRQDRQNPTGPYIEKSLRGPQGEGLIIQSLRGKEKTTKPRTVKTVTRYVMVKQ